MIKRFKIVIAGCGFIASAWIEYALSRDDVEIVALVELQEKKAYDIAKRYALDCGIYTDISEAIDTTGANLVFDVTSPESHKQIVITALERNCDVMGEKPMALSLEDAQQMVAVAEKSGRMYALMQNFKHNKHFRAFQELVASGTIGQLGLLCADFFVGFHAVEALESLDNPLLLDMAVHTFDQARLIIGADPMSAYCHEFNPIGSWYQGNAAAVAVFEFSNRVVFSYRGSCCAEGRPTPLKGVWRAIGSKGTASWDGVKTPFYEVVIPSAEPRLLYPHKRIEAALSSWQGRENHFGHFGCLDEMFTALIEDKPSETDCRDNLKSMAMVFGALESAKRGCKVNLTLTT